MSDQRLLNFNPIELTPDERQRLRRELDKWTIEEELDDFQQLPAETLAEFLEAKEEFRWQLETFGPTFRRPDPKPSEAWAILNGHKPEPDKKPARGQLNLLEI